MAPEVVTGKLKPNAHTDRFSLAVILYMMFFRNHPLEGEALLKKPCLTEEMEREFYGEHPVFVWDVQNKINRPVRGVHTNEMKLWPLFPQFMKDLFLRAFSRECLVGKDIDCRVMETEWQSMLITLRGMMTRCPHCGGETFISLHEKQNSCINCGKTIPEVLVLQVKNYHAALTPDCRLYACHTCYDSSDFSVPTGLVVVSTKKQGMLGLQNHSHMSWEAILPNGLSKEYGHGTTIRLGRGLKINFGHGNVAEII